MHIEIWSDIACPWCFIGKRRFEKALADYPHAAAVEVTWRSFELEPDAPREQTTTTTERLMAKYGLPRERALEMMAQVTAAAAEEGLAYDLPNARSSNTFDGHRLTHLAAGRGLGEPMMERLMRAYQMEGEYLADHATLQRLAVEVGLEPEEVADVLASDRYAEAVRADEQRARQLGITGVPFFVFDATTGVSGAQPTELFARALQQLGPQTAPLTMLQDAGAEGVSCDDEGCAVPSA